MLSLGNGEYCHKDSFATSFKPKQSIIDYIPNTDAMITNELSYKDFRSLVMELVDRFRAINQPCIFPDVSGIDFMAVSLAGLLGNKSVLTHEKMVASNTFVVKSISDCMQIVPEEPVPHSIRDGCMVFFTSGSTGKPSMVKLTQTNIVAGALGCLKDDLQTIPSDRVLFCLPQYHIYEFIMELMFTISGVELFFTTPHELYPSYMRLHPSIAVVVPQILNGLYEKNFAMDLRILISGGAPIRRDVYDFFRPHVSIFANGYGSTETSASVAISSDRDTNGTCSRAVIVKLSPNNELLVKGPSVSNHCLEMNGGWFNTKDLAVITQDHRLKIIGRNSSIIKLQQGEYINLDELSDIYSRSFTTIVCATSLDRYPSAVIFIDDPEMVEAKIIEEELAHSTAVDRNTVTADIHLHSLRSFNCVERNAARKIIEEELAQIHTENHLRGFERIKHFTIRDAKSLPLTASMKVDRNAVRSSILNA